MDGNTDEEILASTRTFEAVKVSVIQGHQGAVLSLQVHPDEIHKVVADPPGTIYMVAMAKVNAQSGLDVDNNYLHAKRRVDQAGLLCKRPDFFYYLCSLTGAEPGEFSEARCAERLRAMLGIQTRSELHTNTEACATFDNMVREFEINRFRR